MSVGAIGGGGGGGASGAGGAGGAAGAAGAASGPAAVGAVEGKGSGPGSDSDTKAVEMAGGGGQGIQLPQMSTQDFCALRTQAAQPVEENQGVDLQKMLEWLMAIKMLEAMNDGGGQ